MPAPSHRRYPGVKRYTPVNEPLTTARFSALYGHWYPHARTDQTFVRALYHQCLATSLAMRAIREINPAAELVQTEDTARTILGPKRCSTKWISRTSADGSVWIYWKAGSTIAIHFGVTSSSRGYALQSSR